MWVKGLSNERTEIDFRIGALWVDGVDARVAEWDWAGGDEHAPKLTVNKAAGDGLAMDLTGDAVEEEVVKSIRCL